MGGIVNIILGVLMIVAGLSGKFVLLGTNSGVALSVIGAIIAGVGCFRLIKSRSGGE